MRFDLIYITRDSQLTYSLSDNYSELQKRISVEDKQLKRWQRALKAWNAVQDEMRVEYDKARYER